MNRAMAFVLGVALIAAAGVSGVIQVAAPFAGGELTSALDLNGQQLIVDADADLVCQAAVDDVLACDVNSGRMTVCNGACPAWSSTPMLGVEGVLEVDGQANFGALVTFAGSINMSGGTGYLDPNVPIILGSANPAEIVFSTNQTPDSFVFGVSDLNSALLICDQEDVHADLGFPQQTNPTLVVHSASTTATHYISMTYDQTDGVIDVGTGAVSLAAEVKAEGVASDGAGKVVCVKSDGNLGTCSDAPNASGVCTCG